MSDKDAATSAADGGKLHWRYQLCALAWLARLLSSGSVTVSASATGSADGAGLVSAADQTRVWQAFRSARVSYGIQATLAFQLILFLLENRGCRSHLSPPSSTYPDVAWRYLSCPAQVGDRERVPAPAQGRASRPGGVPG
jgi:hypothetical protein